MSQRTTRLITAALLSAAPLAVATLPASAATCTTPEVVSTSASPRNVVLGAGGTAAFVVSVSVRSNGCELTGTDAVVTLPTRATLAQPLTLLSSTAELSVFAGSVPVDAATLADTAAGTWKVRTSTGWTTATTPVTSELAGTQRGDDDEDEDEGVQGEAKVSVLRASAVTADATSSALTKGNKIKKGKALTVKGVLRSTSWTTGAQTGLAKQKVDLQFRTSGGTYKKVKSLQTRAGGTFAESVKAAKDGCYRVVFGGSSTTAPATSPGECIDVR